LAIVKTIEANDTITLDQIAVVLGKSRSTVKRIVNSLKEKGLLDREGGGAKDRTMDSENSLIVTLSSSINALQRSTKGMISRCTKLLYTFSRRP